MSVGTQQKYECLLLTKFHFFTDDKQRGIATQIPPLSSLLFHKTCLAHHSLRKFIAEGQFLKSVKDKPKSVIRPLWCNLLLRI